MIPLHERREWRLTPAQRELCVRLCEAIVEADWDALFDVHIVGFPVLPEEVFAAWYDGQSLQTARRQWRQFLRKRAKSWSKYRDSFRGDLDAMRMVNHNLIQIWPGECNSFPGSQLRITRDFIDA